MNYEEQLMHIADCIMIDTMGLKILDVRDAKLQKTFSRISDSAQDMLNAEWSTGSVVAKSGKKSFRVVSSKSKGHLTVEGSNAMHYQGHNIVSSSNAVMTAFSMLDAVRREHQLGLSLRSAYAFLRGEGMEVSRVDTPAMLGIPQGVNSGAIINGLALAGLRAGLNMSLYPNETVYFDQHSQLASLKAYLKYVEMKRAKRKLALPETPNAATLINLAESNIRFESVYRQKYLKRRFNGPVTPAMLSPTVLAAMFLEQLNKYDLRASLRRRLSTEDLWIIRSPYRATVALWQNGTNLDTIFRDEDNLLKSHRRVVLRDYGIDIFLPPPGEIEVPIEIGEILVAENFIPVPHEIRSDLTLFSQQDMRMEWEILCNRLGYSGPSAAYLEAYSVDD
jgi:hypothetical protein